MTDGRHKKLTKRKETANEWEGATDERITVYPCQEPPSLKHTVSLPAKGGAAAALRGG